MEIYIGLLALVFVCLLLASLSKRSSSKNYTYYNYRPRKYYKRYVRDYNTTMEQDVENFLYDERLNGITSADRGTPSEHELISALLDYGIAPKAIFHDLYVKNGKYGFAQIDVAVATRVGIIVFEVKDYSGWIFGRGKDIKWTQGLYDKYNHEKHTHRFYNPVLQNESHIKVLQKQSDQFKGLPFYSVVVFYGNCELRDISFIPDGTFVAKASRLNEVLDTIFENSEAKYTDKHEVMRILKSAVENANDSETKTKHVKNIKDMLGKDRVFE